MMQHVPFVRVQEIRIGSLVEEDVHDTILVAFDRNKERRVRRRSIFVSFFTQQQAHHIFIARGRGLMQCGLLVWAGNIVDVSSVMNQLLDSFLAPAALFVLACNGMHNGGESLVTALIDVVTRLKKFVEDILEMVG